jgi:plasmid maintenance system antidote protein VapI
VTWAEKMKVSTQQVNKWVKGGENSTLETVLSLGGRLGITLINIPKRSAVASLVGKELTALEEMR